MSNDLFWIDEIQNPKALLVVAHPDDETIFAGGLILSSLETQWTIICCVHEYGPRREEFYRACEFLSQESGNPIEPNYLGTPPAQAFQSLSEYLIEYREGYDIVFTHNRMGEYGHEHHKFVHNTVINIVANPNTWLFISPGSSNVDQDKLRSKRADGNRAVHLNPETLRLKIRAFQDCYESQSKLYGYDQETGELRETDLRETLHWEFESGKEEYTYFK